MTADEIAKLIPDEVVSAAHRAFYGRKPLGFREALAVGLAAWPDRHIHEWQRPWLGGMSGTDLILPLPQVKP
jgi:hypothetical protein